MDDIARTKVPKKPNGSISAEEKALRLEVLRQAQANNRIEGIFSGPEAKPVFDAFVRGEIDARDIVPRLKFIYKVP